MFSFSRSAAPRLTFNPAESPASAVASYRASLARNFVSRKKNFFLRVLKKIKIKNFNTKSARHKNDRHVERAADVERLEQAEEETLSRETPEG